MECYWDTGVAIAAFCACVRHTYPSQHTEGVVMDKHTLVCGDINTPTRMQAMYRVHCGSNGPAEFYYMSYKTFAYGQSPFSTLIYLQTLRNNLTVRPNVIFHLYLSTASMASMLMQHSTVQHSTA